jgi:hypothetical protein
MIDLYVYYKVRAENAARLAPLVRSLQAQLVRDHAVAAQLKCRPPASDAVQTWMEVYPGVDPAFGAALERAAGDAGLAELIEGPRRTEVFTDLTACA